jgi:hypothetical protein
MAETAVSVSSIENLFHFHTYINTRELRMTHALGRRVLIYGTQHFLEEFHSTDCIDLMEDWLYPRSKDIPEEKLEEMEDLVHDRLTRGQDTMCSLLDGTSELPALCVSIYPLDEKFVQFSLLHLFTSLGGLDRYKYGNETVLQATLDDMAASEFIVQRVFAVDVRTDHPVLRTAQSFGWYAIRRVWFPAWKVQQFLWKEATNTRWAPDGFAQIALDAREAGDDQRLLRCAKRALEAQLFKREVLREVGVGKYKEWRKRARTLVAELLSGR